ncbi:MAG: TlpA family protein disulfide reductase [Acidimicrobiales bacterium]
MRRMLIIMVVLALAAVGCGGSDSSGEATSTEPGSVPDFSGTTVDGQELVSADYAGQDVMLWFWAPW